MLRFVKFQEFTYDPRLLVCQQKVPAPSCTKGALMVAVTGLQVEPPDVGVAVRVGVRVGVDVGPMGVRVGVDVGPMGVFVRVGVFVIAGGVLVGPPPSRANSMGVR